MRDSMTLQLVMTAGALQESISKLLLQELSASGYPAMTSSRLAFLSTLECGVNYASDVARNLGVSRQMVAKTVKELSALGYLEQNPANGKQKTIEFTQQGEDLIAACRDIMAEVDEKITRRRPPQAIKEIADSLNHILETISLANED